MKRQRGKPNVTHRATLFTNLLALLLLASTGCLNQAKEVARYRKILDAGVPDPYALRPDEPVTLERAMLLANRHNEQLFVRGEDYIQALADKDRAFSAFLPTISLAPSVTYRDSPGRGSSSVIVSGTGGGTVVTSGGGSGGSISRQSSVPLSGSINVFNGFRDVAAVDRAGYTIGQREALLLDLQSTVLLDVAQAFYAILRAEESARVLSASLKTQGENIRFVQAEGQKGIVGPLEVSQSLADYAATKVSLAQAQADAENGRTTLAFLIGAYTVDGELIDQFTSPEAIQPIELAQAEASGTRQDLIAARAATEAAYSNVEIAIREYYPSVSIDSTYLLQSDPSSVSKWSAALRVNAPIFSAGQIEADVRSAWSQYRQSNANLSLLIRQIRRDVQQGYQNLMTSREKLADLRSQVDAAQTAYTLADQRFKRGVQSNLDRLVSLDKLLNAQLGLASESYNEKIFFLDLMRAIGRLHPDNAAVLTSSWPGPGPQTRPTPTEADPPATQPVSKMTEVLTTKPTTRPSTEPAELLNPPTTRPLR